MPLFEPNIPSPLEKLSQQLVEGKNVEVFIKRDDLIHPVVSGNKWRKLKHNLEKFRQGKYERLLTFGGAYSNHIAAVAEVCRLNEISSIGIIRGDELSTNSNSTLRKAADAGMELIFTRRQEYDLREEKYYHEELRRRHGHIMIVPEGGANFYGVLGCQEISKEINIDFDCIVTACGTATTASGLLLGGKKVIGVSALKGGEFLTDNVKTHLRQFGFDQGTIEEILERFRLKTAYHFGGYAKYNQELIDFINDFYGKFKIKLDHIYTGKMMYTLSDLIANGTIPEGSTVIALHTGGLQGADSIRELLRFD